MLPGPGKLRSGEGFSFQGFTTLPAWRWSTASHVGYGVGACGDVSSYPFAEVSASSGNSRPGRCQGKGRSSVQEHRGTRRGT